MLARNQSSVSCAGQLIILDFRKTDFETKGEGPVTYRIKIVRGENQFEVEGDKKFVLDMLAKRDDFQETPTTREKLSTSPIIPVAQKASATGKNVSVGEFIRQLGFTKHTEMVLAFGYFLEKMAGQKSFTPADINTCYYEAKLESSNTSQMIIQNIRSGRMMQARKGEKEGKKAYTLTQTGEEFIEKRKSRPAK
jgi:hypothetical protein